MNEHPNENKVRTARRFAGLALATCVAVVTLGAAPAGATWPGAFNRGTCYASTRSMVQDAEVYRTANESIQIQGAVVRSDRHTVYTPWQAGQVTSRGNTVAARWTYSSMPSGSYVMWYRFAEWRSGAWRLSGWYQVATSSAGTEWYSGISFGGSSGCRI